MEILFYDGVVVVTGLHVFMANLKKYIKYSIVSLHV